MFVIDLEKRPAGNLVATREIESVFSYRILQNALLSVLLIAAPVLAIEDTLGEDTIGTTEVLDSRDVASYREAIAELESSEGAYGQGLQEKLLSLGLSLQQQGRHEEAIKTLKRGVHLARINSGLYSVDQIPLLQTEITSLMARGELLEADERQSYLYRVQRRGLIQGEVRAQALMQQARWQRRAYDMGVGELDFPRLLSMWDLYRLALNDVVEEEGETSLALLVPLNGMLEAQYLISAYKGEQSSSYGKNLSDRYDKSRFNAYRAQSFQKGQAVLGAIDEVHQQNNGEGSVANAESFTRLGDWMFWHGAREPAIEIYREAFMELAEAENAQVELQRLFGAPVPLPSFAAVRPFPETTGSESANLLLEFGVSERGRVFDLRRLDQPPATDMSNGIDEPQVDNEAVANRFMRELRRTRFRPRFENGEPVATEGVIWTYDTTEW
ncbi:MAG: tetratricopeptide (TPR) repeat protein [Alcanivorax sp.]